MYEFVHHPISAVDLLPPVEHTLSYLCVGLVRYFFFVLHLLGFEELDFARPSVSSHPARESSTLVMFLLRYNTVHAERSPSTVHPLRTPMRFSVGIGETPVAFCGSNFGEELVPVVFDDISPLFSSHLLCPPLSSWQSSAAETMPPSRTSVLAPP